MTDKDTRRTQRIAYGDETTRHRPDGRKSYIAREAERCPDCQVGQGELHEAGCDVEQCPECKRQLIRCDHVEIRPIEQYIPGWFAHKLDMHDIGYKRVRPGEMEELLSTHAYHHDLPPRDE